MDVAHIDPRSSAPVVSAGNPKYRKGAALPPRDLRPPRHGLHDVPGKAVRRSSRDRVVGGGPRPAEALCPKWRGAGSVRQLLGQALDGTSVDGDDHRHRRKAGRAGLWVRDERPVDLGLALRHAARLPLANRRRCRRPACVRDARGRRPPGGHPERRSGGLPPNGDGKTDTTAIAYELAARRRSGSTSRPSREAPRDAQTAGGRPPPVRLERRRLPDGRYRIVVAARSGGREVTAATNVVLSRTLSDSGSCPPPSHRTETAARTLAASFTLAAPARANLSIRRGTRRRGFGLRLAPADRAPHDHVARRRPRRRLLGDIDRHGLGRPGHSAAAGAGRPCQAAPESRQQAAAAGLALGGPCHLRRGRRHEHGVQEGRRLHRRSAGPSRASMRPPRMAANVGPRLRLLDPFVVPLLELEQDRSEEARAVDGLAELHEQRGRLAVDVRRRSSAATLTLIPMPSTTRSSRASARIPASFLPCTSRSFGSLISASARLRSDTVCRREAGDAGQGGKALRLGRAQVHREEQARARRGEPRRPRRPRAVCSSATTMPLRRIGRQLALGRLARSRERYGCPKRPWRSGSTCSGSRESRPAPHGLTHLARGLSGEGRDRGDPASPRPVPAPRRGRRPASREKVVARKQVRPDEWYLSGHFPAARSCPACSSSRRWRRRGGSGALGGGEQGQARALRRIDGVRFKRVVEPGDELELTCELERVRGPIGRARRRPRWTDRWPPAER